MPINIRTGGTSFVEGLLDIGFEKLDNDRDAKSGTTAKPTRRITNWGRIGLLAAGYLVGTQTVRILPQYQDIGEVTFYSEMAGAQKSVLSIADELRNGNGNSAGTLVRRQTSPSHQVRLGLEEQPSLF